MTQFNINQVASFSSSIIGIDKITFNYCGHKVYSASKIEEIYAVFVSNVIEASEYFLKWYGITWDENKNNFDDVQMFIKTSDTEDGLTEESWSGPYFDGYADVEGQYGKFTQFCVVLRKKYNSSTNYPNVTNINLKYYTSESSAKFYTRAFNVGFTPKTVVLTYNADVSTDAIIRFAISGLDTADTAYYQYIEPNKIVELDSLTYLSDNIKVLLEITGTSETQVTVHEFALMFSGDEAYRINKVYAESSSSSSTSESSSSSLDSSSSSESSESEGNTSSSSSSVSSSSSSSYAEGDYVVVWHTVGSPDVTGNYLRSGSYAGKSAYKHKYKNYWLRWQSGPNVYYLSENTIGEPVEVWISASSNVVGTYTANGFLNSGKVIALKGLLSSSSSSSS